MAHNLLMSSPGLRERKKAKTRHAIQEAAYRLIREQGYENTTVDQIAAAAEISPATFFRYFPTKEDALLQDEYDPLLIENWRKHLKDGISPIAVARLVVGETLGSLPASDQDLIRYRTQLLFDTPALRARMWDNWIETQRMLNPLIAEQLGTQVDDLRVRATSGALVGSLISAFEVWIQQPDRDMAEVLDEVLEILEQGL